MVRSRLFCLLLNRIVPLAKYRLAKNWKSRARSDQDVLNYTTQIINSLRAKRIGILIDYHFTPHTAFLLQIDVLRLRAMEQEYVEKQLHIMIRYLSVPTLT